MDKFAEFNEFSLAKYNKERAVLRRVKKQRDSESTSMYTIHCTYDLEFNKVEKTMKQVVRFLHISQPKYNVMCILGKRYPRTAAEFVISGLPGDFVSDKAGKRMKLATPFTWETELSVCVYCIVISCCRPRVIMPRHGKHCWTVTRFHSWHY